jgi:hypothetical protein
MNSTIPLDLLELKTRFETWRTNRKYMRELIPDELWNAAAELSRRYPTSLVGRVLKLDLSKLKKPLIKRSSRTSVRSPGTHCDTGAPKAYIRLRRTYHCSSLLIASLNSFMFALIYSSSVVRLLL